MRTIRQAHGWSLLLSLTLLAADVARGDDFFRVLDENPLVRAFYVPLPADDRLADGAVYSADLSISNTLNVEERAGESLFVDGESDTLRLSYGNSLRGDWRYRLTLPIVRDSGGFLDTTVDTYHQIFGFDRGNRPYYPKNQLDYAYSGRGHVDVSHDQTDIGDIAAELGWYAVEDSGKTLSLWSGVTAPTGSVSKLTGDGAWNGAWWAHGALTWSRWQLAGELGVAQPFGDEIFDGFAHKTSVFGRAAVTRSVGSHWSLRVQLDAQSARVNDSQLRLLGPSLQVDVGAVRRIGKRWRIEMGFQEDAAVNTAPDITFFLGIRRQ